MCVSVSVCVCVCNEVAWHGVGWGGLGGWVGGRVGMHTDVGWYMYVCVYVTHRQGDAEEGDDWGTWE